MFYLLLCLFFTIYSKSQDFTSGFSPVYDYEPDEFYFNFPGKICKPTIN